MLNRYRKMVVAFPAFAAIYSVLACVPILPDHAEIFPFFRWSLFSYPRVTGNFVTVRVLEAKPGSPAAPYVGKVITDRDAFGFLRSISFRKACGRLQVMLRDGRTDEIPPAKRTVVNHVKRFGITRFDIVRVRFNVLKYYFEGEIDAMRTITEIAVGDTLRQEG